MDNIEKRAYTLEFRAEDADSRTVMGHAALFNTWGDGGWFREMISPGAFTNALRISDVRALLNHDANHLLARSVSGTLRMQEDDRGLMVEFDLPKSREDIREAMMRGDLNQMSFAFTILRDEWKYDSDKDERTILEVKQLYDVSLVTYPFYSETSAALRSLERWKAENGKDEEEEQRIQKELITLEHRIRHNFLFTKL